jgi:hypothetical protein
MRVSDDDLRYTGWHNVGGDGDLDIDDGETFRSWFLDIWSSFYLLF